MTAPAKSIIDTRRYQMFPTLVASDIERVRRFGEVHSFGTGEALARVGEVGHGLSIILTGEIEVSQNNRSRRRTPIVTYGSGSEIMLGVLVVVFGPNHVAGLGLSLGQKVSRRRGEIALVASRNRRNGEQDFQTRGIKRGAIMTITEYLAATILVALISWAVLGLLMQES